MPFEFSELSAKQRGMLQREQSILAAAEQILIHDGFLELTMVRIAERSKCPRGTIYLHFASREDIVVALACQACENRCRLMQRGAQYAGRPRLRMAGVAEGFAFYYTLFPDQFSILHKATDTIFEKASPQRLENLRRAEWESADLVRTLIEEAVQVGDLRKPGLDIDEVLFAYSAMATGGFALHQMGFPQATFNQPHAMGKFRRALNILGDAYQWHPLTDEVNWSEVAADIRRTVFPEESQRVYGPGVWHGEWGEYPMKPAPVPQAEP